MVRYKKALDIYRQEGFYRLIQRGATSVYARYVVPHLPRRTATYNGVTTNASRLFDSIIPWRRKHRPQYESGLIEGIKSEVEQGDDVVIVGGGWGVTAVRAAQEVGDQGSVRVFEGSAEEIKKIRETLELNGVSNLVNVNHTIVGEPISLRGNPEDATYISPNELPDCDILELDCEGAEVGILRALNSRPRSILVETHGMYGSPPEKIREILARKKYTIKSENLADKAKEDYCIDNGVKVFISETDTD